MPTAYSELTKSCTRCGNVFPTDCFPKRKISIFGKQLWKSHCKACLGEHQRKYREPKRKIVFSNAVPCVKCGNIIPSKEISGIGHQKSYCSQLCRSRFNANKNYHKDIEKGRNSRRAYKKRNPFVSRWNLAIKRSEKKGYGCMSRIDFVSWCQSQEKKCGYCGMGSESSKLLFDKRGLAVDRKDNSKGYVEGNMVFACWRCNSIKSSYLSYDQMMAVANLLFNNKAIPCL